MTPDLLFLAAMLNPRHIVITGASSGIGAALANVYAAPGVSLSLHGRDVERLSAVAAAVRAKGADVEMHIGDVCDAGDLTAWITTRDAVQPIDLVIANAGISGGTSKTQESAAQVNAIMDVNIGGVMNTIHAALPLMLIRRRGQIAIISSLAGFRGFAGAPAYCASKAAVRVYGEGLRAEMAPYGIAINVVCPGFVKTPMTGKNGFPMPFLMPAEKAAAIIRKGLADNVARIAFPLRLYSIVRLLASLPQALMDLVGTRLPRK